MNQMNTSGIGSAINVFRHPDLPLNSSNSQKRQEWKENRSSLPISSCSSLNGRQGNPNLFYLAKTRFAQFLTVFECLHSKITI